MLKERKRLFPVLLIFMTIILNSSVRAETQSLTNGPTVTTDNVSAQWVNQSEGIAQVTVQSAVTNKEIAEGIDYLYVLDVSGSMVAGNYGSSCLNTDHFTWYPRTSQIDLAPANFYQEGDAWVAKFDDESWRYLSGDEVANLSKYTFETGYHRDANNNPITYPADGNGVHVFSNGCIDRLGVMKNSVINSITNIQNNGNNNCRVGVILFGDPGYAYSHYMEFSRDFNGMINMISNNWYSTEYGTYYYSWIEIARNFLINKVNGGDTRPTKIIFITDGSPTDTDVASYMTNEWVTGQANTLKDYPDVTIYTGGMGIGSSSWQSDFLRGIASSSDLYSTINETSAANDLTSMIGAITNKTVISAASKAVYLTINTANWSFYGTNANASTTGGSASVSGNTMVWSTPVTSGTTYQLTFQVKLTDKAKSVDRTTSYPVTTSTLTQYWIAGGPDTNTLQSFYSSNKSLSWNPSWAGITVTSITIDKSRGNVYQSGSKYYVRGNSNFLLQFSSTYRYPCTGLQANYHFYMSSVQYICNYLENGFGRTWTKGQSGGSIGYHLNDEQVLTIANASASRSSDGKTVTSILDSRMVTDKKEMRYYPMARAENSYLSFDSTWWDNTKSIYLICDAKKPEIECIRGQRIIDDKYVTNNTGDKKLSFRAADDGSGMKSFTITAKNEETGEVRELVSSADSGEMEIDLSDPFYLGAVTYTLRASDHVGNVREQSFTINGFTLEAEIERVLDSGKPNFANGEEGIVKITVMGYVDKVTVTFPEEQSQLDGSLNTEMDIIPLALEARPKHTFFVPLYGNDGSYTVEVTAFVYRGSDIFSTSVFPDYHVGGTILDQFRTRIRSAD